VAFWAGRPETTPRDQLRLKTNLGWLIAVQDYGKLPRCDVKAKRFKGPRKTPSLGG
jgi:phenylacetate-CoA ligase